ncbi:MAG: hypothetical protein LCH32_12715 [Bacteroidetes bacterium]|nr:hypothetical protein [Bacteroidota bacterium]
MKNKKWLLLLIIALPSVFWIILETSTINSKKLPFFGPKQLKANTKDTLYYSAPIQFYEDVLQEVKTDLSAQTEPIVALMFVKKQYRDDAFRLAGLWEYINYKAEKIKEIPVYIIGENEGGRVEIADTLSKLKNAGNLKFLNVNVFKFDSVNKIYFKDKPYYVDFSFVVLLDENRNIRGYYDARFVSEIKRLIDEYKHLRLKEAKKQMLEKNEIKVNS